VVSGSLAQTIYQYVVRGEVKSHGKPETGRKELSIYRVDRVPPQFAGFDLPEQLPKKNEASTEPGIERPYYSPTFSSYRTAFGDDEPQSGNCKWLGTSGGK
jgi:hypothetical protein